MSSVGWRRKRAHTLEYGLEVSEWVCSLMWCWPALLKVGHMFSCPQSQLLHLPHCSPSLTSPELGEGTALLQGGEFSITTCAHGTAITLRTLTPSCINLDSLQRESAAGTAGEEGKMKVFHRRHLARCTGKLAHGQGDTLGQNSTVVEAFM